jgi:nitrite reductase/ring-hydroxylating ferredoxin subunit
MDLPVLTPGTRLCGVDDVAEGAGIIVVLHRGWPIVEVIVVRRAGAFLGYFNQCPHMTVPLNILDRVAMNGEYLFCDHHYASFRIGDGYCTEGPCTGDSLASVALAVRDGAVFVA